MTWCRQTPHARKAYWDGPGWPPEVSTQTREHAAHAGWDAAGWVAIRNVAYEPVVESWLDDLPVFAAKVPAGVVAEMLERCERARSAIDMLVALAGGVPPCAAWLFAHDYATRSPVLCWEVGLQLGLSPVQVVGWWHAGLFRTLQPGRALDADEVVTFKAELASWVEVCGPNAYLWSMAGYDLEAAKKAVLSGKTTERSLRKGLAKQGYKQPRGRNDHCAPEREHTEFEKGNWDAGWVMPATKRLLTSRSVHVGRYPIWVKNGWPGEVPSQTRAAAEAAGWTDQDWVGLHTSCGADGRAWLWDMPALPDPPTPQEVRELFACYGDVTGTDILNLAATGVPLLFGSMAAARVENGGNMSASQQIQSLWTMVQAWGMSDQEATGWLLTGWLDVEPLKWRQGTVTAIVERVWPWRNQFGPTAYLWVMAGTTLEEATETVKQPDWDETALRVMVALNRIELPAGV